jgi:hypothetical protein
LQDTPLQIRILDKKELRKLASDGCPNLSFEFEATTDREEEEGSSGALKSFAANVAVRSRAAPVDKSPRRYCPCLESFATKCCKPVVATLLCHSRSHVDVLDV